MRPSDEARVAHTERARHARPRPPSSQRKRGRTCGAVASEPEGSAGWVARYYPVRERARGVAGLVSSPGSARQDEMRRLPDFSRPPVAEVALAVGFSPIAGLRLVEYGRLWDLYRTSFSKVVEQPPVQMTVERFGGQGGGPGVSFELLSMPPLPRVWFVNEDESELVQVQNNWFARNWRKVPSRGDYPRYPNIRQPFESDFRSFEQHVQAARLGVVKPTQCEVTYINHISIDDPEPWTLGDVVTLVNPGSPGDFLPPVESIRLAAQYVITHDQDSVGRLHVTAEPATRRTDNRPIVVLTITARGRPLGEGIEGVVSFLDLGHDWVVRAFESVTTERMHMMWGKQ